MATKQLIAVFGALAFLGTFAMLAAALVAILAVKVIGEEPFLTGLPQPRIGSSAAGDLRGS
jgi:hypothetical protein